MADQPPAPTPQDWAEVAPLIAKWMRRARESQYSHYEAAERLDRAHYFLGIPAAILSTVVGTTVFATLQKQVELRTQIIVGSISVLAAILTATQALLRFSERAEKHRATAAAFAEARRSMESVIAIPVAFRQPLAEFMSGMEKRLADLSRNAPTISNRVFARALAKMNQTDARHA